MWSPATYAAMTSLTSSFTVAPGQPLLDVLNPPPDYAAGKDNVGGADSPRAPRMDGPAGAPNDFGNLVAGQQRCPTHDSKINSSVFHELKQYVGWAHS